MFDGKNYDEVIRKLETAWALDCTDSEAASFADISKASLCEFLQRHPDISERKSRLKEKPVLSARNALHKAINNGNAELALKYLERKCRSEFAMKHEVEHSGHILGLADQLEAARKRVGLNKAQNGKE